MSGNTLRNALKEQGLELEDFSFKHVLHERIVCSNTFNGIEVNPSEFDQWREMNPRASEDDFYDTDPEFSRKGYGYAAE